MSDIALRAKNLSKAYQIRHSQSGGYRYRTLQEELIGLLRRPFRRRTRSSETVWALKDVSLEIKWGEVVGIIGRNGAGKSTLLKILSRITEPTEGYADVFGRVGSLLEVGTGFHPELTGRENVLLSGAILGMRRAEIAKRFDEIVSFAEVEKYIDTPVKRYSSGMFLRLAFSVAAHLETDIVMVDEVLAVGDIAFQKKCLGRMERVSTQGRTVLFVSHQVGQIATLCPRCLLLQSGRIALDGATQTVIDAYITSLKQVQTSSLRDRNDRQGNGYVRIVDTWVENENGERIHHVLSGNRITLIAQYEVMTDIDLANVMFSVGIFNSYGIWVTDLNTASVDRHIDLKRKSGRVECVIPRLSLNAGVFTYGVMVRSGNSGYEIFDYVQNANTFSVEPGDYYGTGMIQGSGFVMVLDHCWRLNEG